MRAWLSKIVALSLFILCGVTSAALAEETGYVSSETTEKGAKLVFSWDSRSKVDFKTETRDDKVILNFKKPVKLKWDRALGALDPMLREVESKNGGKTVVLTLSNPAEAKSFLVYKRDGIDFAKNGLDLKTGPGKPRSIGTMASPDSRKSKKNKDDTKKDTAKKESKKTKVKTEDVATALPPAPAAPASIAAEIVTPPATVIATPAHAPAPVIITTPAPTIIPTPTLAVPAAAAAAAVAPLVTAPAIEPVTEPAPVTVAVPVKIPVKIIPAPASKPAEEKLSFAPALVDDYISLTQLSPAAGHAEESLAAVQEAGQTPAAGHTEMAQNARTEHAEPARQMPPTHEVTGEKIILPMLADDPFVVFSQGQTIWIVTDDTLKLTETLLRKENKDFNYPVKAVQAQQGNILEFTPGKQVTPHVRAEADGKLSLILSETPASPDKLLMPTLTTAQDKNSLNIETGKTGKIVSASDPQTGATLYMVPVSGASSGIDTQRKFVEFSLPATAQGIVVQKTMDDVSVTQENNVINISSSKGLAISEEFKKELEDIKAASLTRKIPPVLFPYALWKLDDPKQFVQTQKDLFYTIYSGKPEVANKARLRLLQLFLAEGLFAEANGMANDILRSSYKFYVENKVATMRGAANFFRQRYPEAERDFAADELTDLPEVKMWQALIAMASGKSQDLFDFKKNYDSTIAYYPPSFIQKLALLTTDKLVERKEYDRASVVFLALQKDGLDEPVKKYFDFMRAKILSETNNEEEAAKIWERQAAEVNDRLIRARAEFSLVNMYLREEKIPYDEATKRLEKLRIVWRGDALELNILTLLGNLYLEQKDYSRALRAWRDIVAYYADVPDAITTARKMQSVFVKLFNKGAASEMPPLTALSLFYEFRDLVPTGTEGDLMIRNLAERLVKMDLLDRASQLLSHQIKNRLQGPERSRVGARLAEIYLMNRQPKQALEILKISGYGDLGADIQLVRIRLTAQALAQQGQLDKAIEVLSSDTSAEGNLLRLSVYWTNWDWPNVVAMAEEILSNRNDPSAPLTLPESEVLLKLATAYVYEQDSGQIQYLRDYFTPLLKNNPNKESFLFITSESGSIDYNNLSNLDKDINTVKSFIDNSRKEAKDKSQAASVTAPDEPVKVVN